MTVRELIETGQFKTVNEGERTGSAVTKLFCCDLLSIAMSRAPQGAAWVTVMGNMNTLAVASLTEVSCVILAEGAALDEAACAKAKEKGITVLSSDEPIFDTALWIYERLA